MLKINRINFGGPVCVTLPFHPFIAEHGFFELRFWSNNRYGDRELTGHVNRSTGQAELLLEILSDERGELLDLMAVFELNGRILGHSTSADLETWTIKALPL